MQQSMEGLCLCCQCITAAEFSKMIESKGEIGQCDFDEKHGPGHVMTVEDFASHVDEFFRAHYQQGAEERHVDRDDDKVQYGQYGSDLTDILSNELQADSDEVVRAIIDWIVSQCVV